MLTRALWLATSYIVVLTVCRVASEAAVVSNSASTSSDDFFSEKLDWNKVKMSKLRILLLGELFKHQIQQQQQQQLQQNDVVCRKSQIN